PLEAFQAPPKHDLDVLDHLIEPRLDLGREEPGDVELPKRLADLPVDHAGRTLPARLHLRSAAEDGAAEMEALALEGTGEVSRSFRERVPANVALEVVGRARLDDLLDAVEKLGLHHHERVGLTADPELVDVCVELQCGPASHGHIDGELVIVRG